MDPTDYLARVERTVFESLRGARAILLIESDVHEREGYWERVYFVAWSREDQSGSHRVHIDSEGQGACFVGHYDLTEFDAKRDAIERAGLTLRLRVGG